MSRPDKPMTVRTWPKAGDQMSSDLMKPPEVAAYLGISKWMVYELLAKGEVPGQLKIGKLYRISRPAFMKSVHGEEAAADQG